MYKSVYQQMLKCFTICLSMFLFTCVVHAQSGKKNKKATKVSNKKIDPTRFDAGLQKLPSGIRYKIITKGKGTIKPKPGDYIMMHIRVYVSDSMTFDSYRLNDDLPVPANVTKPAFNGDIMEGIAMMVEGDSAIFQISQDSMYRNGYKPPFAKPGDPVKYQIRIVEVRTKEQWEKQKAEKAAQATNAQLIKAYIEKKQLDNVTVLDNGLHVAITKEGNGELAKAGQTISVHYTGSLLDGTVFDSSVKPEFNHPQPYSFALGQGKVIKGWDQALVLLKKGAKATLMIPSALAYGEQGAPPKIGANAVLVFEVEVMDLQ
jgi:FKBP-type peptidyl-prolyl cis-trans isomerase FkpA